MRLQVSRAEHKAGPLSAWDVCGRGLLVPMLQAVGGVLGCV